MWLGRKWVSYQHLWMSRWLVHRVCRKKSMLCAKSLRCTVLATALQMRRDKYKGGCVVMQRARRWRGCGEVRWMRRQRRFRVV